MANDEAASLNERDKAERAMAAWLKRHGKTKRDIGAILLQAEKDDKKANPPPPDPRDQTPNPWDIERFDPASLVEDSLKQYVTMSEHVSVICSLWTCFTWIYERFLIVPRMALTSEWPESGKTTLKNSIARLARRPNREVLGTGPALVRFLNQGPCTVTLDELDFHTSEAKRYLQLLWNLGHERDAEISLLIGGKPTFFKLGAPMLAAGLGGSLGGLLAPTQESRTFLLDLKRYTEETKPPRDYTLGPDNPETGITNGIDVAALDAVRAFLRDWAPRVKLNLNPPLPPGMIGRFGDNVRGPLSVAHSCSPQWVKRAHDAFAVLFEREKAARPWALILRHALVIADVLELERIPSVRMNKELLRLDLPDARWNRYRGPSGGEWAHPLTLDEQAMLLRMSGIEAKVMKPLGGSKAFRGYERSWFVEALRKYETSTPDDPGHGRLRFIAPVLGFGLATSPILVAVFSQVPGPVVGAGLPGLVVVGVALLALARRRRHQMHLAGD